MLKYILSMLLIVFFSCRDLACQYFFPEMKTSIGDWDGSNTLTMDIYAMMFFCSFLLIRTINKEGRLNIIVDFLLGYSFFDVFQRFILDHRITDLYDIACVPFIILFVVLDAKWSLIKPKIYELK